VLFEGPETVIHAEGPERILHTCRAFAERPGRTVPRHGVVAEGFDRLLVHHGEEVPRLVVLARMAETEPDVIAEPLARAGELEAAILPAAGPRAGALHRCGFHARGFRLDPDVGLESRALLRCHVRIMGCGLEKTRKRIA